MFWSSFPYSNHLPLRGAREMKEFGEKVRNVNKIREIVNLAEPIFKSQSWKLGHQITLEELEIGHVNEDLTLNGNNAERKM